ncbi:MAG: hypothetical protein HY259_15505 [Chloroflexi bacterium]|nr:hypothetical protein [Chloroflexota bacterium]
MFTLAKSSSKAMLGGADGQCACRQLKNGTSCRRAVLLDGQSSLRVSAFRVDVVREAVKTH